MTAGLLPFPVTVPMLAAALLAVLRGPLRSRRRLLDVAAITVAGSVAALASAVLFASRHHRLVYWFGGWRPVHSTVVGIDFAAGPFGAGLATLAAVLVTGALVFSWHYFESVGTVYHVLMLTFLAAMEGFALTGDVFDMFVFFELMGVSAYALTGYRIEEKGPLQGALNFALTNSVGAFLSLIGVALLYGRTGSLNFAQIGASLSRRPPDALVLVSFVLVISGFLVKSAVFPFHMWMPDAHAVAPTPVCVLFSGVMVELGLYAVARVYWDVFSGALGPHQGAVSTMLVSLGVVTALVGALMSSMQRHLKRMLAFSTMSHSGLFLIGVGLLNPLALAGAAVYVLGHGLVKGALFLLVGVVLHRLGTVDEHHLHGRGRNLRRTGFLFAVAALGLAGMPPFGTYLGKGYVDQAATLAGAKWLTWVSLAASALTAGSVLRAAARVFAGLGEPPEREGEEWEQEQAATEERSETEGAHQRTPASMLAPAAAFLLLAVAVGVFPAVGGTARYAAARMEHRTAYASAVIGGRAVDPAPAAPPHAPPLSHDLLGGGEAAVAAVAVAAAGLYRRHLGLRGRVVRWARYATMPVRAIHSGRAPDYVAWLTFGTACLVAWLVVATLG